MIRWGPTGEVVYRRSYARPKQDGQLETWPETVRRVVEGNLALVPDRYHEDGEDRRLAELFETFAALPAGRHLWMSGVPGSQFLFNCHVAGWSEPEPEAHFVFTFGQLMQGGGVGSNYSNRFVGTLPVVRSPVDVHLVCRGDHPDIDEIRPFLSGAYSPRWPGAVRIEDSREGWSAALAAVLRAAWGRGPGKIVFDLGLIRPRGALIRTFGGTASGPRPLAQLLTSVSSFLSANVGGRLQSLDAMMIDHWIAEAVVAGNVRRSARMSMKHWADPDILDFISAKTDPMLHWSTNISVEVDDDFFAAEAIGDPHAASVLDAVAKGMCVNGEPGIWNRSLSSIGERGDVVCTNPCGEIPLEPWENCNLGHVNLSTFAHDDAGSAEAHRLMARFLLRATFGDVTDPRQRIVLDRNRRIGVGHFGFHGWLVRRGLRYSEAPADTGTRNSLKMFRNTVQAEARRYAAELGVRAPVKTTTVAPTGSVAKLPGATEGIQPIYSRFFLRRVRFAADDPELLRLQREGFAVEPDVYSHGTRVVTLPTKDLLVDEAEDLGLLHLVEAANELPPEALLSVQAMYQACYADNAVSLTVNLEPSRASVGEVKGLLRQYLPQLKGTTFMIDESRPQAPFERISEADFLAAKARTTGAADGACLGDACPIGNEGWT